MTSGKITANDIGKTVYLSNSAIKCQEWVIADVNHDGTSGTVDLMSKYALGRYRYSTGSADNVIIYSDYLNPIRYSFSADVQNIFSVFRLPSLKELGISVTYGADYNSSGTIYPIFSPACVDQNSKAIYTSANGNRLPYWTRDIYEGTYNSGCFWAVDDTGKAFKGYHANLYYVMAFIRFAKV